jgi:hypothetical protein
MHAPGRSTLICAPRLARGDLRPSARLPSPRPTAPVSRGPSAVSTTSVPLRASRSSSRSRQRRAQRTCSTRPEPSRWMASGSSLPFPAPSRGPSSVRSNGRRARSNEERRRSIAMLPAGFPALNRDEALEILAQLRKFASHSVPRSSAYRRFWRRRRGKRGVFGRHSFRVLWRARQENTAARGACASAKYHRCS